MTIDEKMEMLTKYVKENVDKSIWDVMSILEIYGIELNDVQREYLRETISRGHGETAYRVMKNPYSKMVWRGNI